MSDVVDRQIETYREDARRKRRHTDSEFRDLVHLVIRRPDADELCYLVGRALTESTNGSGWRGVHNVLPGRIAFFLARRRVRRRLSKLFGRKIGGFAAGPFTLEARQHILIESDPGGAACSLVTGLCEATVQRYVGSDRRVAHSDCQGRGDTICKWTVLAEKRVREPEGEAVAELRLAPELEAG